ncbi:MAG: tRNA preQ1(34) S-adenosylmethionine ribosyltransferase-isomerase QueA [Candidatus Omnitrophica bacterium]|nr:tRNA preQ1(34) S-adenosylmethionine ribosyltransferase-isomerase QueA [Candidatus Omnitrophota bacterium]MBU4589960.1 tRNA preQ1(34) S-adenosylmethionine ribosyltransferase-isomerase QueA [Candidatus Omnitrophota bacterium]
MKLIDFDYNLPKELIAQYPSEKRDGSRLLVLHRDNGRIEHRIFKDIVEYLRKDDTLVLNNTKVVPARLYGKKESGGKVEALVLNKKEDSEYEVLLKPARGCNVGNKLIFGNGELKAEVAGIENSRRSLRFECNGDFEALLEKLGEMPLPPYIKRKNVSSDKERYQTVYAAKKGAVAAPTAGLHFTRDVLSRIAEKSVDIEYVTLHVGYGTFKPVKCEDPTNHKMEKEYFEISAETFEKLKNKKGRTIAVGTTTCRALETLSKAKPWTSGCPRLSLGQGWTDLFIYPPYKFKAVDALLTNFHLPRTTLLMLVSAFCGRELLLKAYEEAVKEKYRFYSYGDAMLIL